MGVKKAVIVAGLGIAAGYLVRQQMDNLKKVTPEKALKQAKESFKKQGPISGSWIYMKPEQIEKNGLSYNVYRGGVTRNIDGENKQFEFQVDVDSGTIIDTVETA